MSNKSNSSRGIISVGDPEGDGLLEDGGICQGDCMGSGPLTHFDGEQIQNQLDSLSML